MSSRANGRWGRCSASAVGAAAVLLLLIGLNPAGVFAGTRPRPAPLFVALSGNDKSSCTHSSPCATFDRAYRLARPGQVVEVGAGTYPAQSISADSSKASATADVVFQPAAGAQVRILGVLVFGSHVELRNMQMDWEVKPGANGVTFRNIKADGPVSITGASNVSVLGGEIYSPDPVREDSQIASLRGLVPRNILFDGVSFHDFQDVGPGQLHHIECLQVGAAINLTIRNSSFRNCATHDIFIRSWGYENNSPYPLSNIVIENNWLAQTTSGYYAMQILDDLWTAMPRTSFVVRNNSALDTILIRVSNGTAQVHGNIIPAMPAYFCHSYGQDKWFDYNLYGSGVPCGAHDHVGDPRFVDPARLDLRLRAGSAALGHGDPQSYPRLDIEGKLRPVRSRPDAGASQREGADIVVGRSIGSASLGETRGDIVGFYGTPKRTSAYRGSGQRGTLTTYAVPGGLLRILYDQRGRVAGLGTTSRYYSTRKGDGVGVPARNVLSSWKLRWIACRKAYGKNFGSVATYVVSRRGSPIRSLWMVQRAFDGCGRLPR